jgi:2-keto-4-pentenoate hydratase
MTDLDKARGIVELWKSRRHIDVLPAEFRPADLQEIEEKEGRGPVAGYKIAITTPVMQQLCGLDEPCWGAIFASEVRKAPAELRAAQFCRLGIETEIAMRMGEDAPGGENHEKIARRVEACMPAIELIEDLGYDYKRIEAPAIVAGNSWNAGIVLGKPVADWRAVDLAQAEGILRINGEEAGRGRGSDVMGHPLNALAWLADKLAAAGTPLRRGMVVMTGSIVATKWPAPGDRVEIEITGLGRAGLSLA